MLRAVLDTNVLVAGLRSRDGAAFQLLRLVRAGRLVPVVSVPLFFEDEDVLSRPGLAPALSREEVGPFLDAFLRSTERREIFFLWRPVLTDAKAEMLVDLAATAGAVPAVTHDPRDFAPAVRRLGLSVLPPAETLAMLGGPLP